MTPSEFPSNVAVFIPGDSIPQAGLQDLDLSRVFLHLPPALFQILLQTLLFCLQQQQLLGHLRHYTQ